MRAAIAVCGLAICAAWSSSEPVQCLNDIETAAAAISNSFGRGGNTYNVALELAWRTKALADKFEFSELQQMDTHPAAVYHEALAVAAYDMLAGQYNGRGDEVLLLENVAKALLHRDMVLLPSRFDQRRHVLPSKPMTFLGLCILTTVIIAVFSTHQGAHWDDAYLVTEELLSKAQKNAAQFCRFFSLWSRIPNATVVRAETLDMARQVGNLKVIHAIELSMINQMV